ncbi:hypothetical protein JKP88DRAFT_348212 [Tribonema minus]|uniref:Uncharacterized protein n=1 Tax=Tribonema minus TaxID=303371 RepID=A0A836CJB9_9STRA|nr:hypothetical protein JKP88DRAFT_348212 [Tribonema minus]
MSGSYQNIDSQKGTPSFQQSYFPTPDFPSVQAVVAGVVEGQGDDERLMETYSLARSIKVLSMIDAILLTFNAVFFWGPLFFIVMLALAWGPACGYYSAKHYHIHSARGYLVYYVIKVLTDVGRLFVAGFWSIIPLAIDSYIGRCVYVYCKRLTEASPSELEGLQSSPNPAWESAQGYFYVF